MTKNHVGGKTYRYPRVGVSMTDKDVIDRVGALWGIKTYALPRYSNEGREIPSYKAAYRVMIHGWAAAEWMRLMFPLMGTRRQARITEVLAEWDAREPTQARRSRSCSAAAAKRQRHLDGTFKVSAA